MEERWEHRMKKSKAAVVLGAVARMPQILVLKYRAGRFSTAIPDYPEKLPLPDGDTLYAWIETLCRGSHRRPGSETGQAAENWIAGKFREFGLDNVSRDPIDMTVWEARNWSLTVDGRKIPSFYLINSGFSGPDPVTAPLVYVGTGRAADFTRVDATGKIVVADVPFPAITYGALLKLSGVAYAVSDPDHHIRLSSRQYLNYVRRNFIGGYTADNAPNNDVYWNACKNGARAVCLILKDQPSNSNSHYGPYDEIIKPLPALWIGKYDGRHLRKMARQGKPAALLLEGETRPGVMHNVWGVLPGQSEETVMVTSHHDSPFQGAVEDASGISQVLAQAAAWSQMPQRARPRTLVFVVDAGHFYGSLGAHHFARTHPDIMKKTVLLLTLEHLAAREVREVDRNYALTGRPAFTIMFTSHQARIVAAVKNAFRKTVPRHVAALPSDLLGPVPTSDAAGYVAESGVPVISWIGCPYYLLDDQDTLDKIEKAELGPVCETVTELVKSFMV